MKILYGLLVFIPLTILGEIMHFNEALIFIFSALAIVGLAAVMGKATEDAAHYLGERIGGFLNATFGNSAELLLNIFALRAGKIAMVKAALVGSIIGNVLLVLGLSMLFGGLKHKVQKFNIKSVELNSGMLFLSIIGICIPAVFFHTMTDNSLKAEELSLFIAGVMFVLYILQIIFTFVTHKSEFESSSEEHGEAEQPSWSLKKSLIVLVAVTAVLAYISEVFIGSVEGMTETVGLSEAFVGLILIPVIGNAAEHSTAVVMAMKNKMNAAIEVSIGSTLQVILFVMPILVFVSCIWEPMNLIFTPFELTILICSALITNRVIEDGKSNWFEGAQLLFIYLIIGIAFFIV